MQKNDKTILESIAKFENKATAAWYKMQVAISNYVPPLPKFKEVLDEFQGKGSVDVPFYIDWDKLTAKQVVVYEPPLLSKYSKGWFSKSIGLTRNDIDNWRDSISKDEWEAAYLNKAVIRQMPINWDWDRQFYEHQAYLLANTAELFKSAGVPKLYHDLSSLQQAKITRDRRFRTLASGHFGIDSPNIWNVPEKSISDLRNEKVDLDFIQGGITLYDKIFGTSHMTDKQLINYHYRKTIAYRKRRK